MIRKLENKTPRLFTVYLIISLFLFHVITSVYGVTPALQAANPEDCTEKLDQAEDHYYDGEFEITINLVNQCLKQQSLSNEDQLRSYKILARTYLAKDDTILARDNIRIILKLDPAYQPTIEEETPKYVNLVSEVRAEQEQLAASAVTAGISSWWFIGAGGVAAVAIIAIVASGGDDNQGNEDPSLPKPPDFPE
jgi:hypothetical protein